MKCPYAYCEICFHYPQRMRDEMDDCQWCEKFTRDPEQPFRFTLDECYDTIEEGLADMEAAAEFAKTAFEE